MTDSDFKNQAEFETWVSNASQALIDRNVLNRRVGELEDENRELKEKLFLLGQGSFNAFTLREPSLINTDIDLTPMTLFRMRLQEPYNFHVLLQHRLPEGGFQLAHMISRDAYKHCRDTEGFLREMISMFVHKIFRGIEGDV